jgi:hypothetical protein
MFPMRSACISHLIVLHRHSSAETSTDETRPTFDSLSTILVSVLPEQVKSLRFFSIIPAITITLTFRVKTLRQSYKRMNIVCASVISYSDAIRWNQNIVNQRLTSLLNSSSLAFNEQAETRLEGHRLTDRIL